VIDRFRRFLLAEETGESLALVRMGAGLTVSTSLLWTAYSGVVSTYWIDQGPLGLHQLPTKPYLFQWLGGTTAPYVWGVFTVTVLSSLLLALGWRARLNAFLALQGYMALTDMHGMAVGSYDLVISNTLFLLVLAPSATTWSLRTKQTTGRWSSDAPVRRWTRFLLVYQLILMYTSTGLQKVSIHWVPGGDFSALYYILQQPTWQRMDMKWVAWIYPLTQIGTADSWAWEVSAPLWLAAWWACLPGQPEGRRTTWGRRLRNGYLAIGVVFHTLVALFMDIGSFSAASLTLYAAMVHPHEWRNLNRRFRA